MVNTHTPPKNKEVTLLALGKDFGLYGDKCGLVGRICEKCVEAVKTSHPVRVYIEDFEPQIFYGMKIIVSDDVPEGKLVSFQPYRDFGTGLAVLAAFDADTKTWYVRELRDPVTGKGSGSFFTQSEKELPLEN